MPLQLLFQTFMAFVAVTAASMILTGIVYRHARSNHWFAMPNARSSHAVPTPSSGGIGLAGTSIATVALLGLTGALEAHLAWAIAGGGAVVACVGWLDDRQQLPPLIRIIVQVAAAAWALWWIGGLDRLSIGDVTIALGVWGSLLALLAIVAGSNLYNFMDGIDGLVGSLTVVVGSVLAFLLFRSGHPGLAAVAGVLAASTFGFLGWNWHPAKIFMGDVGSVFLGFALAVTAIAAEHLRILPALSWVILLAPAIVDAGFTTVRRALRGERWIEAHRTFSYQRAVQIGHSHRTVVLAILFLEGVLAALAITAWRQPAFLVPAVVLAYALTTVAWARYQFPRPRSAGV